MCSFIFISGNADGWKVVVTCFLLPPRGHLRVGSRLMRGFGSHRTGCLPLPNGFSLALSLFSQEGCLVRPVPMSSFASPHYFSWVSSLSLLSRLLPRASWAVVALLLYCLRCAARGTREILSAPVPQLQGARRLPLQQLSSSRSSSSPPRLGLSVRAAQLNSTAASRAARALSIPWPGILTRIPTLRGGASSRLPHLSQCPHLPQSSL